MVKIYRNEDVEEIVMAIPRGHYHVRGMLKLRDQVIVLQEATLAAIARAYLSIILHPTRRGVILKRKHLSRNGRKPGYAEYQLIEVPNSEEEAVKIIDEVLSDST